MLTLEGTVREASSAAASVGAAFDQRFELVADRLRGICIGLVGATAADDVMHDAYLRARSRYGQLRDEARFEPWLARIAINLCFNYQRDRRRLLGRITRLAGVGRPHGQRDVGLRELIELLPPRERSLVVLHYGHGYQINEIAAMLGLSPTNARTVLFRARARLGRELQTTDR